jgi:hypothetical protein
VKLNRHWLHTPYDGTKAIENRKPWVVIVAIVNEISQSSG